MLKSVHDPIVLNYAQLGPKDPHEQHIREGEVNLRDAIRGPFLWSI